MGISFLKHVLDEKVKSSTKEVKRIFLVWEKASSLSPVFLKIRFANKVDVGTPCGSWCLYVVSLVKIWEMVGVQPWWIKKIKISEFDIEGKKDFRSVVKINLFPWCCFAFKTLSLLGIPPYAYSGKSEWISINLYSLFCIRLSLGFVVFKILILGTPSYSIGLPVSLSYFTFSQVW